MRNDILKIPQEVSILKKEEFKNQHFKEVELSSNIEVISKGCFKNCENLEKIILGKNIKKIENSAFENCKALKSIELPCNLEYIGDYAFIGTNISAIEFPNSLRYIGNYSFFGCLIEKLYLPANITFIGDAAFQECGTRETKIELLFYFNDYYINYCKENKLRYKQLSIKKSVVDDRIDDKGTLSLKSFKIHIKKDEFKENVKLKKLVINADIVVIDEKAFEGCKELEEVCLYGNITIKKRAFCDCEKLGLCRFYGDVEMIGEEAFINASLKSAVFFKSLKIIGDRAFMANPLTKIKIPDSVEYIGENVFYSCQILEQHIVVFSNSSYVENYCKRSNIGYGRITRETIQLNIENKNREYKKNITFHTKAKKICGNGRKKRILLKDVDFSLAAGDMVFIMGGSGSGKSTLLKGTFGLSYQKHVVSTLIIRQDGREEKYELRNGKNGFEKFLTFSPQFSLSSPDLKVKQEIDKKLELRGIRLPEDKFNEVINKYNLKSLLEKRVENLSGGEKKRLVMAIADMCNSYLYILDEPDSGLDEPFASQLFLQLKEKAEEGCIVAVVSHHPKNVKENDTYLEFEKIFNKILVVAVDEKRIGRIVYFGKTDQVKNYFGLDEKDSYSDIIKILDNSEKAKFYIEKAMKK